MLKGTVSLISSESPCKDGNARFTMSSTLLIGEKFQGVNWASLHKGSLEKSLTIFLTLRSVFFRASVESIENASILSGSAIEDYPRISPSLLKQILTNMKQSDSTWKINNQPNVESSLPSKSSNYYKLNTDQLEKESFKCPNLMNLSRVSNPPKPVLIKGRFKN